MSYNSKQIADAVSTVHMNSKRQAKRNVTTNYANGDINFIGDCCFSYSGIQSVGDTAVAMIDFHNGPNYLICKFEIGANVRSEDDFMALLYLNDVKILSRYFDKSYENDYQGIREFIIPPFSHFKLTLENESVTNQRDWSAIMTGKVYSGAEIIQGAI